MRSLGKFFRGIAESARYLAQRIAEATVPKAPLRLNPAAAFRVQKQPHYSGVELAWLRTRKSSYRAPCRSKYQPHVGAKQLAKLALAA